MATHANIDRKEDTQMTKETQQADGLTSHLTQELGMGTYKGFELLEEMPEGWVLDREIGKLQEQIEQIKVEITKLEKVHKYGQEKDSEIVEERKGRQ